MELHVDSENGYESLVKTLLLGEMSGITNITIQETIDVLNEYMSMPLTSVIVDKI